MVLGFALKCLETPTSVGFDDPENLASLTSALSEYHDWIGVRVVDSVLKQDPEYRRLADGEPAQPQRSDGQADYLFASNGQEEPDDGERRGHEQSAEERGVPAVRPVGKRPRAGRVEDEAGEERDERCRPLATQ